MMPLGARFFWWLFSLFLCLIIGGIVMSVFGPTESVLSGIAGWAAGCTVWIWLVSPILERHQ